MTTYNNSRIYTRRRGILGATLLGAFPVLLGGCHVHSSYEASASAEAVASAGGSSWVETGFRVSGRSEVRTGSTITIVGDFAGVNPSDISVTFSGRGGRVAPNFVSNTEIHVECPPRASSGDVHLFIGNQNVWHVWIDVHVAATVTQTPAASAEEAPPSSPHAAPAAPTTECIAETSSVAAQGEVNIRGNFAGLKRGDVTVRFKGAERRPQRATSVTDSQVTVRVPNKPHAGKVAVFHKGVKICQTQLTVVPAPGPTACTVEPSIATVDSNIEVRGDFTGARSEDFEVRFKGQKKPVRPSAVHADRVSVAVPKKAKSGKVTLKYRGRKLCDAKLTIAKKDDGLLTDAPKGRGLVGNIYKLPEKTKKLPNFDGMRPIGSIVLPKLNVHPRPFDSGFPGMEVQGEALLEWFGIRFQGALVVPKSGSYEFEVNSDDGVRMYIDGKLVVENDGVHPPKKAKGRVQLEAGPHEIRVDYFQGPRFQIALQLKWKRPGKKNFSVVPTSALRRGLGR